MIRTIGYGNRPPEAFFAELEAMEPDLVVDVRDHPRGWSSAYSKAGLEKRLGDKYLWLPMCGNSTRELPPTLNDETTCLAEIRKLMDVHGLIVLLCAEKDERRCHRSYIRKKIEEVLPFNKEVFGRLIVKSIEDVIDEFGEDSHPPEELGELIFDNFLGRLGNSGYKPSGGGWWHTQWDGEKLHVMAPDGTSMGAIGPDSASTLMEVER